MSSRTGIAVVVLAVLASPVAVDAAQRRKPVTVNASRHLWATINLCDPADPPAGTGPHSVGVRASMPGSADGREDMFMRFRAQFFSDADMKWHNFSKGEPFTDSGWIGVGKAEFKARQGGFTMRFNPAAGSSIRLRAKVNYEWRLRGNVTRTAAKLTTKGHKAAVAYPPGFSAAECTLTG